MSFYHAFVSHKTRQKSFYEGVCSSTANPRLPIITGHSFVGDFSLIFSLIGVALFISAVFKFAFWYILSLARNRNTIYVVDNIINVVTL